MPRSGTREATHAGSWYEDDADVLSRQLDGWLEDVPNTIGDKELPIPKARVIIAPHAGYSYSGPCAAWAYKCLDLSLAKRVFVLGPSHTYYLKGSALTTFAAYDTPFGKLEVDAETVGALRATGRFSDIPPRSDEDEHSLEMHLPYLWKRLEQTHGEGSGGGSGSGSSAWPTIVPVLVGNNSGAEEKELGRLLAPYLRDPDNAFVVSSDFCHWGTRFSYTKYVPAADRLDELRTLGGRRGGGGGGGDAPGAADPPIHEGIRVLDELAMDAVASGVHDDFVANLARTGNTVCGRHPIGVTMAAIEAVAGGTPTEDRGRLRFVRYERSSLVNALSDSSVSYAAAYATV